MPLETACAALRYFDVLQLRLVKPFKYVVALHVLNLAVLSGRSLVRLWQSVNLTVFTRFSIELVSVLALHCLVRTLARAQNLLELLRLFMQQLAVLNN